MAQQGKFDGLPVDHFKGRFAGSFDIDDFDAMHMGLDGEVMLVITARLKSASIVETQTGDIRRTNVLGIKQVQVVRSQQDREELAEHYNLDRPLELPFPRPAAELEAPAWTEPVSNSGPDQMARAGQLDEPTLAVLPQVVTGPAPTGDPVLRRFLETGS